VPEANRTFGLFNIQTTGEKEFLAACTREQEGDDPLKGAFY